MIDRQDPLWVETYENLIESGVGDEVAELTADEWFENAVRSGYGEVWS